MELIDRQEAIKAIDDVPMEDEQYKVWLKIGIYNLKSVDAEPVRHGKWDYVTVVDEGFWRCSNCGTPSEALGAKVLYKYCPFCGAKMGENHE